MKYLIKLAVLLGIGLGFCQRSQAEAMASEPVGANPMDNPVTLNSPCYISAALGKVLSLQIATLAGREMAEPASADVKRYLDTLRDRYLLVEAGVIDCLASEKAFLRSLTANQGMSAGPAECNAYTAAIAGLDRTVKELPKSVPGETAFDRSLNSTLAGFYGSWLDRVAGYENMKSVNGIHLRLREALDSLALTTVDCRASNRLKGTVDCPKLENQLADANFLLDVRVADLAPKVAALTKNVKDDQTAKAAYMSQAQSIKQQMMAIQNAIPQHMAVAQYFGRMAQHYMRYFQYYLYYGNVFAYYSWYYAVYGYWGIAHFFWWLSCCYWNAAGYYLNIFYWFMNGLNAYMAAIATMMQQMKALHDAEPVVIANIQAAELDLNTQKAIIIGIKVDRF